MAMPDDISDELDILRRVFPKWQGDDILNYLMKTPPENRVKRAICKYIRSHDTFLNRADCEADAKMVHEIFPEVPFANIFKYITILGDERNRVRICLRLLLSENGFQTNSDIIDGHEIKEIIKKHTNMVDNMNSTLASLNDIRNKYKRSHSVGSVIETRSDQGLNSESDSDIMKAGDTVALSESPILDLDELTPSQSKETDENQLSNFPETNSLEIISETISSKKENIICKNPFGDSVTIIAHNKKTLVDLTPKLQRPCGGKPYDLYRTHPEDIINLDTQEHIDVIIENKRIPEPIKVISKTPLLVACADITARTSHQKEEQNIQVIAGPSGIPFSKRKSKLFAIKEDIPSSKKSKMDDSSVIFLDTTDDEIASQITKQGNSRKSVLMYNHLFDRKKRDSVGNVRQVSEDLEETLFEDSQEEIVYDIDNRLYFPLMEIFPEACPIFLKQLCNGKVNEGSELDRLISAVLDREDYPRRKEREDSQIAVVLSTEDQLEILTQVLPEADPMYLKKQIEDCNGDPEAIKLFINQAVELKDYPTLKERQRKQQLSAQSQQYTENFSVERFLEQIPDPQNYFKEKIYEDFSYEEFDYLLGTLKNIFYMLPIKIFRSEMKSSKSITGIFERLQSYANNVCNHLKQHRKPAVCQTVLQNIPFLQEVAYNIHRTAIISYQESRKQQVAKLREQLRSTGALITCTCCYDEELLPEEIVTCETGCVACKSCVQKSTEVAFGEAKTKFPCVGGCGSTYTLKVLQDTLTKKLFSKVAQKQQLDEVRAAGLEDLVQCPFCDFANIPSAEDKLFRCFNPECMKESCRTCREPNHIPLRCEELEKDADVQARTAIENRLTEAILRTCWQCKTKFIKSDGCNKMTCPKCMAFSCYVCGKSVKDYKHFNGQGGDRLDLCPLYSDTNKLHEEAVLKAAEEAKKDVDPNTLKFDPTTDLQTHFAEYNKKNPIVLPPGVQLQGAVGRVEAHPVVHVIHEHNVNLRPQHDRHNANPHRHQHRQRNDANYYHRHHDGDPHRHRFDANQNRYQPRHNLVQIAQGGPAPYRLQMNNYGVMVAGMHPNIRPPYHNAPNRRDGAPVDEYPYPGNPAARMPPHMRGNQW